VRLLIRPERVALGSAGPNTIPARVSGVMYLGDHSEVRLELVDGTRLIASVRGRAAVSAGERVFAHLPEDAFLETR
jgi:ABC-type Fe3+/spermidine/putrescine transport system ATPase subunit